MNHLPPSPWKYLGRFKFIWKFTKIFTSQVTLTSLCRYPSWVPVLKQNIGADRNVRVDRNNWHGQNSRVDKILASTKILRQQNDGAKESLYCLAEQSPQQLTSPRPHWWSPTSRWRCWFPRMQSPSGVLPLVALLLWADSLPHRSGLLYQPAMQKTSQILASTKFWCPTRFQDFTYFRQTIAVVPLTELSATLSFAQFA